uniref:Uncharacterized protein n=1 Tax=Lactuca sativa TaxID=4236 RepID=A0A9R1WGA3_LACSA|nr:hypothetical protein LSAT_V11C100007300 [Lactuca sativa]
MKSIMMDIMEWEEDSDEYIRKNLPYELVCTCSNCLLVIRIQPTVTNCEPVKYSDGQQHVNEEEVVGEAFEDSVLQKLQKENKKDVSIEELLMNGKWIVDDNLEYSGHTRHMGDFNYPRLAYFVAATSGSNKVQCQKVLEELDVKLMEERNMKPLEYKGKMQLYLTSIMEIHSEV